MVRIIIWLLLFYVLYLVIRSLVRNAVKRGIRDYEAQKEEQHRKEKEVKIDRNNIEDAHYEDLRKK